MNSILKLNKEILTNAFSFIQNVKSESEERGYGITYSTLDEMQYISSIEAYLDEFISETEDMLDTSNKIVQDIEYALGREVIELRKHNSIFRKSIVDVLFARLSEMVELRKNRDPELELMAPVFLDKVSALLRGHNEKARQYQELFQKQKKDCGISDL